ncbi:hypothetical protein [Haemophilus parainfluenzae]|uniref:hypothetical protein n=1 Tax=Haemophilus parainfluenzae TaxID=729 RepID=UPI000A9D0339|nr:hypothetical protein [Haemophilus parainfluenzae]
MSKTAFILTAGHHVFEDAFMPIVIAMRESKGDILILHRAYTLQGKLTKIKEINLNHYTLEISLGNARAPPYSRRGEKRTCRFRGGDCTFQNTLPYCTN